MGTLPTGPSVIKSSGMLLSDYISKNPACLGSTILDQFQEQLPFLFKVLSVNKSLSIQAHPNKVYIVFKVVLVCHGVSNCKAGKNSFQSNVGSIDSLNSYLD